ncbi:hypothetical protein [Herbaspirillum camelliae]|uniref:hypothetical protein n=1 Tax=Herbaspirillum camelliae TaxID=1892903 RepID=UPI000949C8A8|nr:hypothetical protein [Herbaspirillum camelliae]
MSGAPDWPDEQLRRAHRECRIPQPFEEAMQLPPFAALIRLVARKNWREEARLQQLRANDRKLAQANDHD